jgi:hypothetical protein
MTTTEQIAVTFPDAEFDPGRGAQLDEAHTGHIHGAFGTILHGDTAPRRGVWHRARTLLAILGPGLIVMVGDNDAGAFGTYTQAGLRVRRVRTPLLGSRVVQTPSNRNWKENTS